MTRPCKAYLPRMDRYVPAATWNLSAGGVLVHFDAPVAVAPGDRLFVGIALKRRQAILESAQMLEARVVRLVRTTDGRTAAGLQFVSEPATESRRAA